MGLENPPDLLILNDQASVILPHLQNALVAIDEEEIGFVSQHYTMRDEYKDHRSRWQTGYAHRFPR